MDPETMADLDFLDAKGNEIVRTLRKAVKTSPVGSKLIVSDGRIRIVGVWLSSCHVFLY